MMNVSIETFVSVSVLLLIVSMNVLLGLKSIVKSE
jgi:hypothetical protein